MSVEYIVGLITTNEVMDSSVNNNLKWHHQQNNIIVWEKIDLKKRRILWQVREYIHELNEKINLAKSWRKWCLIERNIFKIKSESDEY